MPDAAVSSQVTDSVTPVNTKVLGDAPAIAMGNLFIATSQALANAAHNATNNQQQSNVTGQAATTEAIMTLLTVDTAASGVGAKPGSEGARPMAATASAAAEAGPETAGPETLSPEAIAQAVGKAALTAGDPILALMVLDAGVLAIFDAVAHLQRTSAISEAAIAAAMANSLKGGLQEDSLGVYAAAEDSLSKATDHLAVVGGLVIDLVREARRA